MSEWFLLVVVTVIFILSLTGAFVLFKFLKSSALIKKAGYQAGGAIAGFLLIYGALYSSFDGWLKTTRQPTHWTITGTVEKEGATKHDGITVKHQPPKRSTLTNVAGAFELPDIPVIEAEGWPRIGIDCDDYYPVGDYQITEENADMNRNQKKITLDDDIVITRIRK